MKINRSKNGKLLNQPNCHDHKDQKKKPCQTQPKPGLSQGECAFYGAWSALQPITDVAHLVHGPSTCISNIWGMRGSLSSGEGLQMMGFTTDIGESDVIFGGTKRLYQAILNLAERYKPAAVFVYNTCITALIGDDINVACKDASAKTGLPVIPINSPGFMGGKNFGSRVAGEHIIKHVIGTVEPEYTTPYDINIIGDSNIADELWGILPLFKKLGIRVLSKITNDARYREICYAHRAKLNITICSQAPSNIAQKMEERYHIPYLEESFYGIENVNRCLRNIAAQLGDADLQERTLALIAEETAKLNAALAPYRARLQGKRILLYTGGMKSWSMVSAAQELGMEVVATRTYKSTQADKLRICELMGPDANMLNCVSAKELVRAIKETKADLLVASEQSQYAAFKASIPFLNINQKRYHSCAGYTGMLEMARELDEAIHSPVWQQVRLPSPWPSDEAIAQEPTAFGYEYEDDEDDGSDC